MTLVLRSGPDRNPVLGTWPNRTIVLANRRFRNIFRVIGLYSARYKGFGNIILGMGIYSLSWEFNPISRSPASRTHIRAHTREARAIRGQEPRADARFSTGGIRLDQSR